MSGRTFIVTLRRPRKNDPRTDPFWEFGSFGCTGCHRWNLLHPKNCQIQTGDRLAFIQGGNLGARLLLLSPAVERINYLGGTSPKGRVELRWDSSAKPFRYERAPSLFESPAPGRAGLFPQLAQYVCRANRPSFEAKFASRFRARARPLEPELADELRSGFGKAVNRANKDDFIAQYGQALPWCDCPTSASERREDYGHRLRELRQAADAESCKTRCCK